MPKKIDRALKEGALRMVAEYQATTRRRRWCPGRWPSGSGRVVGGWSRWRSMLFPAGDHE